MKVISFKNQQDHDIGVSIEPWGEYVTVSPLGELNISYEDSEYEHIDLSIDRDGALVLGVYASKIRIESNGKTVEY